MFPCEWMSIPSERERQLALMHSFHKRCVRSMYRVSLHHVFHPHISLTALFQRLNVMGLESYYHNRQSDSPLRWPHCSDAYDL